jgi:hypothetical protein
MLERKEPKPIRASGAGLILLQQNGKAGKMVDFDAVVNLMDDEIREEIHREFAPCTAQEFVDEYIKRHRQKFGEEFTVN